VQFRAAQGDEPGVYRATLSRAGRPLWEGQCEVPLRARVTLDGRDVLAPTGRLTVQVGPDLHREAFPTDAELVWDWYAEQVMPGLHAAAHGTAAQPTWEDLLTLMVIVSDNTATNLVISRLGLERVQAWLAQTLPDTRLVGRLQLPPELRNDAQRRGERNTTTARDTAALLTRLYRHELLDDAHTRLALDILGRQQFRDILARHVPRGVDGEPLYRVLSKSGELTGVHHDAGLLLLPRPLSVAVLSVDGSDPREHPDNRDVTLLAATIWPLLHALGGPFGGHSY